MRTLDLIKIGSNLLREKKIPTHIQDSEILLSKTLNKKREEILVNLDKEISEKNIKVFKKYLKRRSKNEPLAYILEEKEFWSKKFLVNKDTLIPRPETELLIDELLKMYQKKNINFGYRNRFRVYSYKFTNKPQRVFWNGYRYIQKCYFSS